jgi:hypothetical protein
VRNIKNIKKWPKRAQEKEAKNGAQERERERENK